MQYMCSPGAGPFLVPGHNLNKHGRSLLDDATYQISRGLGLLVSDKIFFMFSLYKPMSKHMTPGAGPFLAP